MQRTQFMGQDERYSDTSVVAQKVSDESISRDEFEVFLCTICDRKDPNKEAGDFGDPAGLGQYNEEFRNKEMKGIKSVPPTFRCCPKELLPV